MYDYYLGGSHNFDIDRAMAEKVVAIAPETKHVAQANRAFLRRAVEFCLRAGVRQFLDLGSGIPTVGNVHEIVQRAGRDAAVVYVDIDPVAVTHSEAILVDVPWAQVVRADMRDPAAVLGAPRLRQVLDLTRPVALLMVSVVHFLPDSDDPVGLIKSYRQRLAPGSALVLSHMSAEGLKPTTVNAAIGIYSDAQTSLVIRPRAEIAALFEGFDLVEPGLVRLPLWHPEAPEDIGVAPDRSAYLCGVGRLPSDAGPDTARDLGAA